MVLSKRPLSSWTPLLRHRSTAATRRSAARQSWHQIKARGYASSGGHGSSGGSSDIQWAIGSVAATIPALYWIGIYQPSDGHGHGDDAHGEHEEEEGHGEEEDQEEAQEEPQGSGDESEQKNDSDSESDDEQDTPDTSEDEGEKDDGSKEKEDGGEATKSDGKNTVVKYPDAKGGIKNRKESNAAKKAGQPGDDEDVKGDKGKSSKSAVGNVTSGATSGKQEGLSNTDTKHSYDLDNDTSRSKKPEGGPDTAKAKGTVDPKRPQAEKKQGAIEKD